MADVGQPAGDGRRKGKKNRARQGGKKKQRPKSRNNRNQAQQRYVPEPVRDDNSILGGRILKTNDQRPAPVNGPPDGFTLFCSYYLGVTPDDGYQKPDPDAVARRYGLNRESLQQLLVENGLDEKSLRQARFDLEGARLDIRVAPQGISRTEIARDLYNEFLETREDRPTS